jgi:photosystem II stability/assembly factor-like uncharacterized protein
MHRPPFPPQTSRLSARSVFLSGLATLLLVGAPASAQIPLQQAVEGLDFREIGPAVMGGRVSDFAVVESDPSSYYVGMASGGVWFTDSDGTSWTPVFDDQPCSSIGATAVHPSDHNFVWVGTGEPQNRQSSPYGCGIFRSMDGGKTWLDLGLEETRHVGRIELHPSDPDIAYVAAVGDLFAPNEQRGVFRTSDGGASWERVLFVDEQTGAIDLAMHPTNPDVLYAAMYQRRRTPFGFNGGGPGSGIYRTRDGGASWERLDNGLPDGDLGRIGLDVYRGDGDLVYATVEAGDEQGGVYRTADGGASWERVSSVNPRPMYFSLIRIDPSNPERIYLGGTSLQASDDGGRTWWDADGDELIHVDHHALWIDPTDPGHVRSGNDGGVASSRDGARTWRILNNFATGQFYEIGVDMSDPYRVCGGLQDSDAWCGPSQSNTVFGTRNRDWVHLLEGDGFHVEFPTGVTDVVYAETQNGNMRRLRLATREVQVVRPVARPDDSEPDLERDYRFNWNAPLLPSAHDPDVVYLGGNHLLRSLDRGMSWEEASPDLTRAIDRDTLTIMGRLVDDESLSAHDGVSAYGTITAFSESPLSPDLLYVGTDDGNLQVSRDGGASWENVVGQISGLPALSPVSRIEASHAVEGRLYVSFDRHLAGDYRPLVYTSDDFGRTWQSIADGLPEHSVNVVREHPATPELLFVGNEIGVFVSVDRGASWAGMTELPTVPVDDLVVHPRDNDLVVGTHGRSIWILDDLAPLQEAASDGALQRSAHLFEPATATEWFLHQDWPFWGEAYEAEDPPYGARIRYWLREGTSEEPTLRVSTADGRPVRTLSGSGEAGLHEVVWDLREALPAEVLDSDEEDAAGARVMPGSYRVTLEIPGDTLERSLTVRLDPRADASAASLSARHAAGRSAAILEATGSRAQDALERVADQLDEALELMGELDADSALLADGRELRAEVDSLSSDLADAVPGRLLRGIESTFEAPTEDTLWQIERGWTRVPSLVDQLNRIITETVPAFYRRLDEAGVSRDHGTPIQVPARPPGAFRE